MKSEKIKIILSIIFILFVILIIYYPSLKNNFTNWDDPDLVTENLKIKELTLSNLHNIFFTSHHHLYHPLVLLTYSIEYHYFKLNPFIYHFNNLLLHILNCLLILWFIYLIMENIAVAFLTSLIFAIHPLKVESVAWVTERKDVLYSFFYLFSLILYTFYQKKPHLKFYILSILFFFFSLLSKSSAITLPFVLILLDYFQGIKIDRNNLIKKIPFFILLLLFVVIGIISSSKFMEDEIEKYNLLQKFLLANYVIYFYLYKIFLPFKYSCIYPNPIKSGATPNLLLYALPIISLILLILILKIKFKKKIILFGILFFIITLSTMLQIIPTAGAGIVFDRYTYIPSIGIFFVISHFLVSVFSAKIKHNKFIKWIFILSLVLLLFILSMISHDRCYVWKNSISLWKDAVVKYPNIAISHHNLGNVYNSIGKFEKAIVEFNNAISLNPKYFMAYNNRGIAYMNLKNYKKSVEDFNKAIELKSNYPKAYNNRGVVNLKIGKLDYAVKDFTEALKLDSNYQEAYKNRGVAYASLGKQDNAILDFNMSLKLNPYCSETYNNLGNVYFQKGDLQKAILHFSEAIKLNPNFAEAYNNRAVVYYLTNNLQAAIQDIHTALKLGHKVNQEFLRKLTQNK